MATELTLYQVEREYLALLDMEEAIPEDQDAEYQAMVRDALLARDEKSDGIAQFLLWMIGEQDACKAEEKRLQKRRTMFMNAEARMRRYVESVIKSLGLDRKGKHQKFLSTSATLFLRELPAGVVILNEDIIPDQFKSITLEMPLDLWRRMCDQHPELEMRQTLGIKIKLLEVETSKVKEAFEAGQDVPGADYKLRGHDYSLVVK